MTQQEYECTMNMGARGGTFVSYLASAYQYADAQNRAKLRSAFADLFTRYGLPSVAEAKPATEEEMLCATAAYHSHLLEKSDKLSMDEFAALRHFVRWYYAQPEGGACHE